MKQAYLIELENKYPEYQNEFKVVVIAESKEEAELKAESKYPNFEIESTTIIRSADVIL